MQGTAIIDTGAKHSIAGHTLYSLLQSRGCPFVSEHKFIKLADGVAREMDVLMTNIDVHVYDKIINTDFLILPEANNNETLLGIDFLMSAQVCLDFSRQCWYFSGSNVYHQMCFEPMSRILTCSLTEVLREDEGTHLALSDRKYHSKDLTPFVESKMDNNIPKPVIPKRTRGRPKSKPVQDRGRNPELEGEDIVTRGSLNLPRESRGRLPARYR
ncbi:hypothetical protein ACJJTC_011957 [Scirpophaga incertulas]